jgi:FAD/FMN-containing dehydrogenase
VAGPTQSAPPDWQALARAMKGSLLRPTASGYATASRSYNPRFDGSTRPEAIARCATADDVTAAVRFAADARVPFAMRSGGHSYGGWSTSPGLVVDVSGLNAVTVDTASGTARIGAGAKLAEVYAGLAARGVAVAGGSCPTVGIAGLALGGGLGVLNRSFGLTCDAIRAVDIVTADGTLRHVSARADADSDLFWALRGGGGGSFGAVTALTMAVRSAPRIATFFYAWDLGRAHDVLAAWQQWVGRTDRKLWSTCKLLADPGTGRQRVSISGTWTGTPSTLDAQLAPLLATAGSAPTSKARHQLSYAQAMLFEAGCSTSDSAAECIAEALTPQSRQAFAATSSVVGAALPAAAVDAAIAQVKAALNVAGMIEGGVSFDVLGGAVGEVAADATAFVHRQAFAIAQYTATFSGGDAGPFDAYVRGFRAAMQPWCGDSAYVNYADPSIADHGSAYWGANYARLQQVKRAVDPTGLFTFPQAVRVPPT